LVVIKFSATGIKPDLVTTHIAHAIPPDVHGGTINGYRQLLHAAAHKSAEMSEFAMLVNLLRVLCLLT
jgi:hypothetical protein